MYGPIHIGVRLYDSVDMRKEKFDAGPFRVS